MIKLRYQLVTIDEPRTLVFQVLEQSPKFVSNGNNSLSYTAANGIRVVSWPNPYRPGIYIDHQTRKVSIIAVRGPDDDHDFAIGSVTFDSIRDREAETERIKDALFDWAQNAPEFKESNERDTRFEGVGTVLL